ncbi:MAG: hypothetical protein J6O71_01110 [Lachnospiraceae bacterium]|nr:hypothetical protein [Lachnospiraceae bacterium]
MKSLGKVIKLKFFMFVFTICLILSSRVIRASDFISAYDMLGNSLRITDGNICASSDVLFKLPESILKENEIFVCRLSGASGEAGVLNPVYGGEFILSEGEAGSVEFLVLDEVYANLSEIEGGQFSVSFIDAGKMQAMAELGYEKKYEAEGLVYLTGSRPYIKVSPQQGINTFISVTDTTGNKRYAVTEEDTYLSFQEGSYGISVFTQDGWGRISYAALPFKQFIYDNSAPAAPSVRISSEKGGAAAGSRTIFFQGNIELKSEAVDNVSGIEKYIYRFSDGSALEGNSLILEPPFEDTVEVFAVDRAGNLSEGTLIDKNIVLDAAAPVLSKYSLDADPEKCIIKLEYTDELSGMKSIRVKETEEEVYSRDFDGRNLNTLISEFTLELSELKRGNNSFKAVLTDNAGNESEYTFAVEKEASEAPVINLSGTKEGEVHTGTPVSIGISISHDEDTRADYRIIAVRKNESGEAVWQRELRTGTTEFTEEGYYTIEIAAGDSDGNTARLIRHFTIDTNAPVIATLEEFNKKILSSFGFNGDPGSVISDYSHVDYDVLLNGQEYDGSSIEEPGKYVLKLVATDELGRTSSEKCEFIISSNSVKVEADGEQNLISENMLKVMRTAPVLNASPGRVTRPVSTALKGSDEVRLTDEGLEDEEETVEEKPKEKEKKGFLARFIEFISEWLSG